MKKKSILITGVAGFIGFNLSNLFLKKGYEVVGLDNINDYYSIDIKNHRLKLLKSFKNFIFVKVDISDNPRLLNRLKPHSKKFSCIFHLAAQAGVRYSIVNPDAYLTSNMIGFFNMINFAKNNDIKFLFYASSSSVYGDSIGKLGLSSNTSRPLSFYAATKKSNEVTAFSYSNLFNITTIGLRFFTVYGPYGRPDMSIYKFTKSILDDEPLELYNNGDHARDFTYIDDATNIIYKIFTKRNKLNKYNIFNISNGKKVKLAQVISCIETSLRKKAKFVKKLPLQLGDIHTTLSETKKTNIFTGYKKRVSIEEGIKKFIKWYVSFH